MCVMQRLFEPDPFKREIMKYCVCEILSLAHALRISLEKNYMRSRHTLLQPIRSRHYFIRPITSCSDDTYTLENKISTSSSIRFLRSASSILDLETSFIFSKTGHAAIPLYSVASFAYNKAQHSCHSFSLFVQKPVAEKLAPRSLPSVKISEQSLNQQSVPY